MPAPETVHLFDPLDFLAELTQHIPPARVQLIRRYGLYSSRSKGHWTRMPYVPRDNQGENVATIKMRMPRRLAAL